MNCGTIDWLFVTAIGLFVLAACAIAWWHSSLCAALKIRHPSTYQLLGRPDPMRTAESDRHSAAIMRFIWSSDYDVLDDAEVARHVQMLRATSVACAVAALAAAAFAASSPAPQATLLMACLRVTA